MGKFKESILMNCIIYARVSTKEQEKGGFSIPAQLKLLRRYAIDKDYRIIKEFKDTETAKKSGRTNFNMMLKFLKENKCRIILVEKTDRLYRNFKDYVTLDEMDLEIHLVKDNQIISKESKSSEKFVHGITVLIAKHYIDNLREEVKKGMKEAINEGRWVFLPPIGYKYKIDEFNKKLLTPTEDSIIVKEAFDLASKGIYTQNEIREIINRKFSKRIARQTLNRMLHNILYAGYLKMDWFPDIIKGIHEPIISEEQFYLVQDILEGKKTSIVPKLKNNPMFPLRRFVICSKCGHKITGGLSQGRSKKYAYYRCLNRSCHLNIKKDILEEKFYYELKALQPEPKLLILFEAIVKKVWENHNKVQMNYERNLRSQLLKSQNKKKRIEELVINGTFDSETYKEKSTEIQKEIHNKEIELCKTVIDFDELKQQVKFTMSILSNLADIWLNTNDINTRQRIQSLIYPNGIEFDGEYYRTAVTLKLFRYLHHKSYDDVIYGGANGTRTRDPLSARQMLSQLSYSPTVTT